MKATRDFSKIVARLSTTLLLCVVFLVPNLALADHIIQPAYSDLIWSHPSPLPSLTQFSFGDNSNDNAGFKYIPQYSSYICGVDVIMKKQGSPVGNVGMKIYQGTDDPVDGSPFLMATSSNVWLNSDFTTSDQYYSFYFGTGSPPGNCMGFGHGQTYWFVLYLSDDTGNDNTNRYKMESVATSETEMNMWSEENNVNTGYDPAAQMWGIRDGSAIDAGSGGTPPTSICGSGQGVFLDICRGITSTISYFFSPTTTTTDAFTGFTDTISEKIPFSYFYGVADIINAESTSDTNSMVSFTPDMSGTALPISTPLFSIDTIKTYVSDGQLSAFRDIMTGALWIMFAIGAFNQIRGLLQS